jgi:hypothetical protein
MLNHPLLSRRPHCVKTAVGLKRSNVYRWWPPSMGMIAPTMWRAPRSLARSKSVPMRSTAVSPHPQKEVKKRLWTPFPSLLFTPTIPKPELLRSIASTADPQMSHWKIFHSFQSFELESPKISKIQRVDSSHAKRAIGNRPPFVSKPKP